VAALPGRPYSLTLLQIFRHWMGWQQEQHPDTLEWVHTIGNNFGSWWKERKFVRTDFKSLGEATTLSLVASGYLRTRQALIGTVGFKPLDVPPGSWFEELLEAPP